MATIDSIIQAISPGCYASTSKTTFVELATGRTDATFFGGNYSLAVALRACHMWVLATYRPGGSGGPVTSESENAQSRSYGTLKGGPMGDLAQTQFGIQLYDLIKSSGVTMGVVTGPTPPTVPSDGFFPTGGGVGPW